MASTAQSSSTVEASPDIDTEAVQLMGQGKRHLVMGEIPTAVNCLQEASALLAAKYGELADECGEVYFDYGRALLELGRMETGVLGNALEGVPEEDDDDDAEEPESKVEKPENVTGEEREKISDEVIDAMMKEKEAESCDEKDNKKEPESSEEKETKKDAETSEEKETKKDAEMSEEKETKKEETSEEKETKKEKETKDVEEKDKDTTESEETKVAEKSDKDDAKDDAKDNAKDGKAEDKKEKKLEETEKSKAEKAEGDADVELKEDNDGAGTSKEQKSSEDKTQKKDEAKTEGEGEKTEEPKTEGEGAKMEEEGTKTEEEEEDEGMEEGEEGTATTADGEAESKGESEEVSNFQLAWEMLELAKVIFKRKGGKEGDLRVAQCYLKLGEVGLETENYAQSVTDFQECLNLQIKHLESENRLLAESHYQLGLANSFNKSFDPAIEHLLSAKKVIEDRLALLAKRISENEAGKGKEKASSDDPLVADQKEVDELRELIPDIMAKIEDAEEMKKSEALAIKAATEVAAAEFGVSSSSENVTEKKAGSSEPVKDISHLVRRKRKPEDEAPKEDDTATDAKKPRSEAGAGDAKKPRSDTATAAKKPRSDTATDAKKPRSDTATDAKKPRSEAGAGDANTNGVNGTAKLNGVNGVEKSPDKEKEIATKSVDDLKKDAKKDEAAEVPMETTV